SLLQRRSSNFYECGGVGHFSRYCPNVQTNECCWGVQNRPAEDGRVHVVEPRAREALKQREPTPAERRRRQKVVFRIYARIRQCKDDH
nr:hypothetical protein [Tanacetum cinerariifolium]